MEYTREELAEAKRQIDSTLHKLREAAATMEARDDAHRCRSQITLARRRIAAFEIAHRLIEDALDGK